MREAFRQFIRRLWHYYPAFAVILALLILDQALLFRLNRSEPITAAALIPEEYRDYASNADFSRPHLIILGSSRAGAAVNAKQLEGVLTARGMPYQVFDLSRGDGGTPSALLANLESYTPIFERLPEGSKVIYLFSFFEMNFIRDLILVQSEAGRSMLRRFVFDQASWVHRLHDASGFARWAAGRHWRNVPFFSELLQAGAAPLPLPAQGGGYCNFSGLYQWAALPINDWALREMARRFAHRMLLVSPPVSEPQRLIEAGSAMQADGETYVQAFTRDTGVPYVKDFGASLGIPDAAYFKMRRGMRLPDCDHLGDPAARLTVANGIAELLREF